MRFLTYQDHSHIVMLNHFSEDIIRNVNQFRNLIGPGEEYAFKLRFVVKNGDLIGVDIPRIPESKIKYFRTKYLSELVILYGPYFMDIGKEIYARIGEGYRKKIYYNCSAHFNEAGGKLVSEIVSDFIYNKKLLY